MNERPSQAGGFFHIVAILAGFGVGVMIGQPLFGTIVGTLAGTAIAITVWYRDSGRSG
jgi:hypothetical protein